MKITEAGVLPSSDVYFHTASETAKQMYFYLRCTGRYQCDGNYAVDRQSYNSFLILYVTRGKGYMHIDGKRVELSEGHFAILDCYQPHKYGTDTGWNILWIHFIGKLARQYYQVIQQNRNGVILPSEPYAVGRSMEKIFAMYHRNRSANEPIISKHITALLTEFVTYSGNHKKHSQQTGNMEEILAFITDNITSPLSIEDLAKKASLSPYYFIRLFKKETGHTPHEYLLIARVNAAKFYLKTTTLPIKDISYRCGFSNDCNFCTTFKRLTGKTPLEYRNSGTV